MSETDLWVDFDDPAIGRGKLIDLEDLVAQRISLFGEAEPGQPPGQGVRLSIGRSLQNRAGESRTHSIVAGRRIVGATTLPPHESHLAPIALRLVTTVRIHGPHPPTERDATGLPNLDLNTCFALPRFTDRPDLALRIRDGAP
jgi:hypothetical protein